MIFVVIIATAKSDKK